MALGSAKMGTTGSFVSERAELLTDSVDELDMACSTNFLLVIVERHNGLTGT